jgi:protein gp37
MAFRLKAAGQPRYRNGFELTLQDDIVELPLRWKKPREIFVGSMTDIFHKDVPLEYIKLIFNAMEKAHWHIFQILTKRADRLAELANDLPWPKNVWMGVTVESEKEVARISKLQKVPAAVKFLSMEPLLGPISEFPCDGIDWIIVGGESGPRARPIEQRWVLEIRNQCIKNDIRFFFKQWGGTNKKKNGRLLDGKYWDQYPPQRDMLLQPALI